MNGKKSFKSKPIKFQIDNVFDTDITEEWPPKIWCIEKYPKLIKR